MQRYFITATGTGIGKTLVTTTLAHQQLTRGKRVIALKPVISGYDANDDQNDTALILRSCHLSSDAIESISPWRFQAPLSPHLAAAQEGKTIDTDALIGFCWENEAKQPELLLVEGVGGVMSPLTDNYTMLDWMAALGWPVVLVAGSYLGSISHALTALEVLKSRGLTVAAVLVTATDEEGPALNNTAHTLERFAQATVPVVKIPRLSPGPDAWMRMPNLTW